MWKRVKIISSLCLFVIQPIKAENYTGFYIGGGAGQATYDISDRYFGSEGVDDSDKAFKLIAGYQFNDYLSLEGGYVDLGKLSYFSDVTLTNPEGEIFDIHMDGIVEIDGLIINIVGSYPIAEQFSIYTKVGMFSWEREAVHNSSSTHFEERPTYYSVDRSGDGSDVFYGLGLSYNWNSFYFRVEYEKFKSDDDIDTFSLGAVYHF